MNNLDPKKEKLINDFINLSKGKSSSELLPLILAISNKAKQSGINFTKEETKSIVNEMQKSLPPEEQTKLSSVLSIFNL